MNVLCGKKPLSQCLQVYLSAQELQRVELFQKENLRKSISSAVRALVELFFKNDINKILRNKSNSSEKKRILFDEKREKVVQCYLPLGIAEKLNQFRIEKSFGSDSECARVIIIKSLDNEGIE